MISLFRRALRTENTFVKSLCVAGILNGRKAFVGPEVLHMDLTNQCNNNCIGCWCRSPLLGDKEMPEWEKQQMLPLALIKQVIDDLRMLGGLKQVKLVGGGEPFMHPHILEIIRYLKEKISGVSIDINTNFTLVTEPVARELIRLGVDSMTVSLWAGDPATYVKTHPMKKEEDFTRMESVLKFIAENKTEKKPWIKIYNVISNVNYATIETMVRFGLGVRAEDMQFVLLDPIPQRTDCLLLSPEQAREFLGLLQGLKRNYDSTSYRYSDPAFGNSMVITEFDGLIRRLSNETAAAGIYDAQQVARIPCYVGWLFARIIATGDVVPCCKGHRMSMGNVRKQRFSGIWRGRAYDEFRYKAKHLDKSDPYFMKIGNDASKMTGCYNCDNLWQNQPMHELIRSLPIGQAQPRKLSWR
jgi:MoaA/NifB/PqqE/SkfB family radical SAM enzyme